MDTRPAAARWLDDKRTLRRLWRGFLVLLALSVLAGLVVPLHPHFAIEALFGFSAWFGFLACAALIGLARGVALLLGRPDDYYERRDE